MKLALLAISALGLLTLAGCATGPASQPNASMSSMPMAMMADKEMMDMCMAHMSQMTPETRQQHMEMMHKHHQMMDQRAKPQQPD